MEQATATLFQYFNDASWLVPLAISVVLQIAVPHKTKSYLPSEWPSHKRRLFTGVASFFTGLSTFVLARWALTALGERQFNAPDFVLSALVAAVVFCLVPVFYSKLPASFRQRYSYTSQRMKRVRLADGTEEDRDITQRSGDGEKTMFLHEEDK